MSEETKKTASERIKNLEETLLGTLRAVSTVNQEQEVVKEAIRLLGNKLDSVVKLLNAGAELSDSNIATQMIQNKADSLAQGTADSVKQGLLAATESVDSKSFVVAREVLDDGTVINPRIQFVFDAADEAVKNKLMGAKVLDKILIEEGKARLELLEIYSIQDPQQTEAAAPAAEAAPAEAPAEAPAPEAQA